MPEQSRNVLPNQTYQPGDYGPLDLTVDDDITRITVSMDRSDWADPDTNPEPILSWQLWRSEDNGQTWLDAGASSTHGGLIISDEGLPFAASKWTFDLPEGTGRQLRIQATIARRTKLGLDVDTLIRLV